MRTMLILFATLFLLIVPETASAGGGGGDKADGPVHEFIELRPLMLPIINDHGISQTINLLVTLEVDSSEKAAKVDEYKPKLQDAFLRDMYGVLHEHAALKGGVLQLDLIRNKLKQSCETVLGEDVVTEVLLQAVNQRQL